MPSEPANLPGYPPQTSSECEDSQNASKSQNMEFADMPLELKNMVFDELFPTNRLQVVREDSGRLRVMLDLLHTNVAHVCPSARQGIRHKTRKMRLINLEYWGSKAWSPATLCPELVLLPTRITENSESFRAVTIAKICVNVDMTRERAAANETGRIAARARDEWEYITTLVTRECLQGWLELLAAHQFNEIPWTFEGSPDQPGAASVPWIHLKVDFPGVTTDLDESTRQLLADEEEEVLNTIGIVRHPENSVEVPERLNPDLRNEVLRKMNVRDSTLQEFLENAIAVFRARIEMLNDQFTFGAKTQHRNSPFDPLLYLNLARTCSELLWSAKHCAGPLRSAVDPYELKLEELLSLVACNAESCACALERFPEGIHWHPDGLQCNHEVCVLGFLTYASVEFSQMLDPPMPW
ncbi:hypothetical protein KC342_g17290 [Hortaea werneckii]|nr:hypothetical protein KC342_g17290 [Hortaea werneckii]KAI7380358.1 hypothetical protein KC328_g12840 [Hortaea werneckii]